MEAKDREKRVHFSEIKDLLKKYKKKLSFFTVIFALLAGLASLLFPPKYYAEATFREKSKSNMDGNRSIALLVGGPDATENAAVSVMKSRKIAEKAVLQKNLQMTLQEEGTGYNPFKTIVDNLKVEWAYLIDYPYPVLHPVSEPLQVTQVGYESQVPTDFLLTFTSEDTFVVNGKIGEMGKPFVDSHFSFTLNRTDNTSLIDKSYNVIIEPVDLAASKLLLSFSCETDLRDKSLIKLTFKNSSRELVADYLNTVMDLYLESLKEDQKKIAQEQVAYLHERQEETSTILKEKMEEHALSLSSSMATIDFLFQTQQSYTQKLLLLDMELCRLQKARGEGLAFYDRYWLSESGDSLIINQILNEIRQHRQQADSIHIALRDARYPLKSSFDALIKDLEGVRQCCKEARVILTALENRKPLPSLDKLAKDPKYMFKEWQNFLKTSPKVLENHENNFKAYVGNMIHLLDVEEKILEERLTHNQASQGPFQGIDLTTANQIYVSTSKSLQDVEADILHHQFLLEQLMDPSFEASSLSSVLQDSVSKEIINKAGQLALQLQDRENRTLKELERLKNELTLQKAFLSQHLKQTMGLQEIRKKLYEEKITAIQNMQLELIQQKVSVLEQSLLDYIDSRLDNLKQERSAIHQQQKALQEQMALMPEKWAQEKLIDQQLEMNLKMMEEITKIIETKNIGANIEISQSAPLDIAIVPIHPTRPYFLLFSFLGGLIGFLGTSSLVLTKVDKIRLNKK